MSAIFFHTPSEETRVRGTERGHMGCFINDVFFACLDIRDELQRPDPIRHRLPPNCYLHKMNCLKFEEAFRAWASVGWRDESYLLHDGERHEVFTIALNTALAIGSNPVKLYARLHGQCEIHCWVDGPNRRWLSDIIEHGMMHGPFRNPAVGEGNKTWNPGWDSVLTLLRSRDDEPVVCSYSVTEQFPNATSGLEGGWVPRPGDEDLDSWYDLPDQDRWRFAMAGLAGLLEMKPEDWHDYRFGAGVTAFHLRQPLPASPQIAQSAST